MGDLHLSGQPSEGKKWWLRTRRRRMRGSDGGMEPVEFHNVADWRRDPTPENPTDRCVVWVSFDDGMVFWSQSDHSGIHSATWDVDEFVVHFRDRLRDEPAAWLLPHLERLADDPDGVESAMLAEYGDRHDGAEAPTYDCDVV